MKTSIQYAGIKPFLRWAGGKRWLLPKLIEILSKKQFDRYVEPFLGGGAVFFGFLFRSAILSDINNDLIITYIQVRDNPEELHAKLSKMEVNRQTYYEIRKARPDEPLDRAARFLYLNRTAFAGIYRVNKKGYFNVPYGGGDRTLAPLLNGDLLFNASKSLQGVSILSQGFERTLAQVHKGDLVYCDPTYTVTHNDNGFRRYNESIFSWQDQELLAQYAHQAVEKGATVVVSNAYHNDIKPLYKGFKAIVVERGSWLCPDTRKRRLAQEYLFFSR
jgi:DNA adenine methylase